MTEMNAAHFIYIPVCILIGMVFGWILGGRAARDAYMVELARRDERKTRELRTKNEEQRTTTKNTEH